MKTQSNDLPRWVAAVALTAVSITGSGRVQAQIPVHDPLRFIQMTQLLDQVRQLTDSLTAGMTELHNAATTLGGGSLVGDILLRERNLTADLNAISYHFDTVSGQFHRVFPDAQAAKTMQPADVADVEAGWDREIHQSALAAARAQTALSSIDQNTEAANAILERSKANTSGGEGSQLAKLQAFVQMLGVVNSDVATLASTIATTERVRAAQAATEASAYDVDDAQAERMLRGYSTPASAIPEIDPRFLSP